MVVVAKSCLALLTPWAVDCQAHCLWDFPGKNTEVGCPFPSPGDLPDPGLESRSPALQADSLLAEPPGKPFGSTKG